MRASLLALLLLPGCYLSHERAAVDAAVPVADAEHLPDAFVPDAEMDAGPPDGGTCEEPLLLITQREVIDVCADGPVLGQSDRYLFLLNVQNLSDRVARVTRLNVAGSNDPAIPDEGCSARTISWVGLRNWESGDLYGETVPVRRDETFDDMTFLPTDFLVPPGEMVISVEIDIASLAAGACTPWGMTFTFTAPQDIDVVWEDGTLVPDTCVCAYDCAMPQVIGTPHLFFPNARPRFENAWSNRTVEIGGERQVGEFIVSNYQFARATATVQFIAVQLVSLASLEGRTLRVYADAIAPANLLGTAILGPGGAVHIDFIDEDFVDLDVEARSPRRLVMTLETDGIGVASTVQTSIVGFAWTDGIGSLQRGCLIDGATTTFALAP